jgi:hypothetical protein
MASRRLRPLHRHDLLLIGLVGLQCLAIAGYLGAGGAGEAEGTGGWRRVAIEEVLRRIEAGDLSGREALWYQPEESRAPVAP